MVYIERELEEHIFKWLDSREILAVRGPRQSGKTTLLKRIKEKLVSNEVDPNNIVNITFEDNLIRLKFEENCNEFIRSYTKKNTKTYFLFDEIQYINDIGNKLKLIFDSFENIKIIATGSSSFDLTNMGKYLVGRVLFFDLYPFSFREFLRAKSSRYEAMYLEVNFNVNKPLLKNCLFLDELNILLHEYLTFGAYPRIVLEEDLEKKKELLKNLFTTYVEKDIVSLHGNIYRDKTILLLKILANILGNLIRYEGLTESSGLTYKEIKNIMPLLQDSFVISIVMPFHRNLVTELKKNPKIYFIDYGIRNYLIGNFEALDFAKLYENFIYNQLSKSHKLNYWRTTAKTEVDFIIDSKEAIPIEVKTNKKITRALRSFIQTYDSKIALVPNLKDAENKMVGQCNIYILPFAYL